MNCHEILPLLADLLDDLLEPGDAEKARRHAAACPACAAELDRARARRERLLRPYYVPPPPPDLAAEAWNAWRAARRRRFPAILRYAAAFLLGVVATLAARPSPPAREGDRPPGPPALTVDSPSDDATPRRIR